MSLSSRFLAALAEPLADALKRRLSDSDGYGFGFGYLFGKARAREDKFMAVTRAICVCEIAPSMTGFETLLDDLMDMVDEDGVFRWAPKGKPG